MKRGNEVLGVKMGRWEETGEKKEEAGAGMQSPAGLHSLGSRLSMGSHSHLLAFKALLVAPDSHLCEHRSWEEAAGLHVGRDLLQALRGGKIRPELKVSCP